MFAGWPEDGPPPYEIEVLGQTVGTHTCPRKLVTPTSWEWIRLHNFYRRGHLPFSGGLYEQPARFVDAMSLLDAEIPES